MSKKTQTNKQTKSLTYLLQPLLLEKLEIKLLSSQYCMLKSVLMLYLNSKCILLIFS